MAEDPHAPFLRAVLVGEPPPAPAADPEELAHRLVARGLAGLAVADGRARAAAGGADLPGELREHLRPVYVATALHSTLVLESARRALAALGGAGISALAFKGVALLRDGTYRDPGARPLGDADLLIRPDSAGAAVEALGRAGFEPWEPWDPASRGWVPALSLTDRASPPDVGVSLDLHWATPYARLRYAPSARPDPLWEGASPPLPTVEGHFALLAEHLLKHLRVLVHLPGLADLARLAGRLSDGDALRRHAERRGSLPGLRRVVAMLRVELGVDLAADVAAALGPPLDPPPGWSLAALAGRGAPDGTERVLGDWWAIGTPGASLAEVARVAAPPGAWLRARYPGVRGAWRRRVRYLADLVRWLRGRGGSPLSPNQGVPG